MGLHWQLLLVSHVCPCFSGIVLDRGVLPLIWDSDLLKVKDKLDKISEVHMVNFLDGSSLCPCPGCPCWKNGEAFGTMLCPNSVGSLTASLFTPVASSGATRPRRGRWRWPGGPYKERLLSVLQMAAAEFSVEVHPTSKSRHVFSTTQCNFAVGVYFF